MKKLRHKFLIVLLSLVVLFVGALSYMGLNGVGYHKFIEMMEYGDINFWYTNELMTDYYNNMASVYNQNNRGVNVVPKLVPASEFLERIYRASVEGEDFPDIYAMTSDMMEKAYLSGLTHAIENEDEIRSKFHEVALEAASYEGNLQAYPLYFDTSTLVYNKTLLEEIALDQFQIQAAAEGVENPEQIVVEKEKIDNLVQIMLPETVDELIEFSNNLEAPDGMDSVFKWNINDVFFNYFYLGEYARLTGEEIDIYNENIAACMDVFHYVTEYFYMDAETVSTESVLQEFMEGKVLFTILDSESALKLEAAGQAGELSFAYDYALIPNPSESLKGRPLSVTNVIVVNGYTELPEATAEFAEFLSVENYAIDQLYRMTGYIPACEDAVVSTGMERVFKEEYKESATIPNRMALSNFWMLLEKAFNEIWEGADAAETLEALEIKLKNQIP